MNTLEINDYLNHKVDTKTIKGISNLKKVYCIQISYKNLKTQLENPIFNVKMFAK